MRNLIVFSFVMMLTQIVTQTANAQIVNTWKGGTPGQENNWACSKNWSLGRIPGVFDNVIIPDVSTGSQKFPVINSGLTEINQLHIHTGATVTVQENVRILVNELHCAGICIGCSKGVWIEGSASEAIVKNK
jgi:hypothetical protein